MSEPIALTRENLKVLKGATSIVIRHYTPDAQYKPDGLSENLTLIEAIKRVDPKDGYGERDLRVEIPVNGAHISNWDTKDAKVSDFSWVLLHTMIDTPIGTLIHGGVLRVGDRLSVKLYAGNNNENLRNARLTKDEIYLLVERGPVDDRSKCKRLTFMLDDCVCNPHSSARNVRFTRTEYTINSEG